MGEKLSEPERKLFNYISEHGETIYSELRREFPAEVDAVDGLMEKGALVSGINRDQAGSNYRYFRVRPGFSDTHEK